MSIHYFNISCLRKDDILYLFISDGRGTVTRKWVVDYWTMNNDWESAVQALLHSLSLFSCILIYVTFFFFGPRKISPLKVGRPQPSVLFWCLCFPSHRHYYTLIILPLEACYNIKWYPMAMTLMWQRLCCWSLELLDSGRGLVILA